MSLTAEQIEKSRAELLEVYPYLKNVPLTVSGNYHDRYDNALLKGWLARQETLCVELPENQDRGAYEAWDDGHDACLEECRASLQAAGIAHK